MHLDQWSEKKIEHVSYIIHSLPLLFLVVHESRDHKRATGLEEGGRELKNIIYNPPLEKIV